MRMEHMAGQIAQLLEQTRTKVADMERERQVTFNLNLRHYRSRQQHLRHRVVRLAGAFERQHLLRSTGGIVTVSRLKPTQRRAPVGPKGNVTGALHEPT